MDSDDVLADRFDDLENKLTSTYSLGSDKIMDHLAGMGQALNKDHIELRNMLIELLENTRPQDESQHLEQGISAKSVVSTMATVSNKVDVATSPILVAMIECSTSPPPVLLKEQASSPILLPKYRDVDAGMSHHSRQSVNTILLTPPPRDAASPDTLMETMSYLSSHHSDDISDIDLELEQDSLQVDRVSPSWASDSSAESEDLSESEIAEAQEERGVMSPLDSPAQMSSLSMTREDGSVLEHNNVSRMTGEAFSEIEEEISSMAAGTLLRLPTAGVVVSDIVSLHHSDSLEGSSAIQMPVPTRANLSLGGQLAVLMTPEQRHVDQGISAGRSNVGASYAHQATSPLQEPEDAVTSPGSMITSVDEEVSNYEPEAPPVLHEDKSVEAALGDQEEKSIDAVPYVDLGEKSVDAIPSSTLEENFAATTAEDMDEEKSVDALLPIVGEDKSDDALAPIVFEEKSVDALPPVFFEEKSINAISAVSFEERAIDAPLPTTFEEKATDTLSSTTLEDKAIDALSTADIEDKGVDALPATDVEEKGVDALPSAEVEEKGIDALPIVDVDEKGIDALPATIFEEKSVDALSVVALEEKAVDTMSEVVPDTVTYAEKDCDTVDLADPSAISPSDVADLHLVEPSKMERQDAVSLCIFNHLCRAEICFHRRCKLLILPNPWSFHLQSSL